MPIICVFCSLIELLDGHWEATYNSIDGYNLTEDNAGEIWNGLLSSLER